MTALWLRCLKKLFWPTAEVLARIYIFEQAIKERESSANLRWAPSTCVASALIATLRLSSPLTTTTTWTPGSFNVPLISVNRYEPDLDNDNDDDQVRIGNDLCSLDVPNLDLLCTDSPRLVSSVLNYLNFHFYFLNIFFKNFHFYFLNFFFKNFTFTFWTFSSNPNLDLYVNPARLVISTFNVSMPMGETNLKLKPENFFGIFGFQDYLDSHI